MEHERTLGSDALALEVPGRTVGAGAEAGAGAGTGAGGVAALEES